MRIEVDCECIWRNADSITRYCKDHNIEVVGVTKGACGHPEIARSMLAGGIKLLGDSRLEHIRRLRKAGIDVDIMMLRLPSLSEIGDVVRLTQISMNSQLITVQALSDAAQHLGVIHQVILMVDVGDRREGVMPEKAVDRAKQMAHLPGIGLVGVGTNVSCIGGVQPTRENTQLLVDVAEDIEDNLGISLPIISGGNTSSLMLLANDEMPTRINQLRIGEGILRGKEPNDRWELPAPCPDAFTVVAEIIEMEKKPSLPEGPILFDAFGRKPVWKDLGIRQRAILAIGEQDLHINGLTPIRSGITIIGASSDHLVVDVTETTAPVQLGETLKFSPNYAALATGMANHSVPQVITPLHRIFKSIGV